MHLLTVEIMEILTGLLCCTALLLLQMYLIQELCATTLDETLGQGVLHNPVTRELDWVGAANGVVCLSQVPSSSIRDNP
jgi:hypothetical protein